MSERQQTAMQSLAAPLALKIGVGLLITIGAIVVTGSSPIIADTQLLASTYLGSAGDDLVLGTRAVAVDAGGNVFVVIQTDSPSPAEIDVNGFDTTHNGSLDLLVCRFTPDLSSVTDATFLGGGGEDSRASVCVAPDGSIIVAGMTNSYNFPTSPGCFCGTRPGGEEDLFVTRLSNDLSALLASTYVGSSEIEQDAKLSVTETGDIILAALSAGEDFPVSSGAYDTTFNGWGDLVVCRLSPDLTQLVASTFLGGQYTEDVRGVHVDSEGAVFVAAMTQSANFPTTPGAYDETFNGPPEWDEDNNDVVVSKLSPDLSDLLASTYIGGSHFDFVTNSDINGLGQLVLTGHTRSPTYPTTSGAWVETHHESDTSDEGFITILNNDLSDLVASTFILDDDDGEASLTMGLVVENDNSIIVSGITFCYSLPTTPNAPAPDHAEGHAQDLFLCKFNPGLSDLRFCTYLGGTGADNRLSLATGPNEVLVGVGHTASLDFPVTAGAIDTTFNGGDYDGYVALFDLTGFDCCGWYTGGYTGNANCSEDGKMTLSDVTMMIDRVYVSKQRLCCETNGDINISGGDITLSDITRLIDHLYISKQATAMCE